MNSETIIIVAIIITVVNVLLTIYNFERFPITIEWRKTFWHDKKFGVEFYKWNKDRTEGTRIFGFNFRKEPDDPRVSKRIGGENE